MTTKALADVKDVYQKLEYPDDTVKDADIQRAIEEAHRRLETMMGRRFIETHVVRKVDEDGNPKTDYDLAMAPIYEVDEVLNNTIIVDAADYNIDYEAGTISFTTDYRDDEIGIYDELTFSYVPMMYLDLEVWIAVQTLITTDVIARPDDQDNTLERRALRQIKNLKRSISQARPNQSVRDGRISRGTK